MTRKDYQSIVDTLNEMNRNIEANEHEFNNAELLAQKNLMDMLAQLFGANLIAFFQALPAFSNMFWANSNSFFSDAFVP